MIAIVIFQSYALINLKWTRNTTQNKLEIKNAILNKKTKGSSNIANGVILGLKMIKERKYKNPVTYMFVFSNGQDNSQGVDQKIAEQIQEFQIEQQFIINTYGYGLNCNTKLLSDIAKLREGTFTYVENIEQIHQCFISTMDGKLSLLAQYVKISIIENYQNQTITKIIGNGYLWKQEQPGKFSLKLNFILKNEEKDYVLFWKYHHMRKLIQLKMLYQKPRLKELFLVSQKIFKINRTQSKLYSRRILISISRII